MSPKRKRLLIDIGVGALVLALIASPFVLFYLTVGSNLTDPGGTPEETARILVEDRKFGFRGMKNIQKRKDDLLDPLRSASNDFTRLDNRNSVWIAEVLARNRSPKSLAIAKELYERTPITTRLVGATALAAHGILPGTTFDDRGLLADVIRNYDREPLTAGETDLHLAVTTMEYSHDDRAVPFLILVLQWRNVARRTQAKASLALEKIGHPVAKQAIPTLISALGDPQFYAVPEAFNALIALGDRRAVPLAIERLDVDIEERRKRPLVDALEAVTGEENGLDQEAWRAWWMQVGEHWRVPQRKMSQPRAN